MSISTAFHKNVSLLLQAVPASYDFKKHYREGMFEKPNTAGFMYVSHYLLSIYDPEYVKKMIEWPITCKKTEAKYRNDVKDFLNIISNNNPDIGFPTILPSLLLSPGGTKFIRFMWKLSQVTLREYIRKHHDQEILFAPKKGVAEELTQTLIGNITRNSNVNNTEIYVNLLKSEKEARSYAEGEIQKIQENQKDIFQGMQILMSLAAEAPVHPSFQKRLLNVDDDEIIHMWREDLKVNLAYFKNKVQLIRATEDISKIIFNMTSNIINESTVLNGDLLPEIDIYAVSELSFANIKTIAQNLYTNNKLNLPNYFQLFCTLVQHCGKCISSNRFSDLHHCHSQLEASTLDLNLMKESFSDIHSAMIKFSSELPKKSDISFSMQFDPNESIVSCSDLKNVMFMPSPPIQFNSHNDEKNEMHDRLKLTPVEGPHKQLFLRYNKNQNMIMNTSRLKPNITVTRINFDDTIASEINERQSSSPCRRFVPPKTIWSTCKPTGKYSRLFYNRATSQPRNRGASCSLLSIPCSFKANSTAMNIMGDGNNAELTLDMTMKSLFSYNEDNSIAEKKSTPKKSKRLLEQSQEAKLSSRQEYASHNEDIEFKFQKPCSPILSPIKCETQRKRRRSITDLVERYKQVMEKSVISAAKLESIFNLNIAEEI